MKHIPIALAAVLVLFSFLPGRQPPTGPVAVAMQSATSADRAKLSAIYSSLADVTERDGGKQLSSTALWRAFHSAALRLAAGSIKGKYAGLDVAVEKVLADHTTLDDLPMNKDQVDKLVAGCREVVRQAQ